MRYGSWFDIELSLEMALIVEESVNRPIFSVVIPTYNRSAKVLPTLLSVQHQTLVDLECLVIDDGSHDGDALRQVVMDLDDVRFRYFRQDNSGGGGARNTGIFASTGKYIAFLDSDDQFKPYKLEEDLHALEQAGPMAVVFSRVWAIQDKGRKKLKPARGPRAGEPIAEYLSCGQGFTQTSTIALQRELARQVGFRSELRFAQDTDFAIRLEAHGAQFQFRNKADVIMDDQLDPTRVSQRPAFAPYLTWLEEMRPKMTDRAYFAFRGWTAARLAAPSSLGVALRLYFGALLRGALPPPLAIKALIQILVPRSIYRRLDPRGPPHQISTHDRGPAHRRCGR